MRVTHELPGVNNELPRVTSEIKKEFDLQVNSFLFSW